MVKDWVKEKLRRLKKQGILEFKDAVLPDGELKIILLDKNKKIISIQEGKNLVVAQGRDTLAKLLGCKDYAYSVQDDLAIHYIKVGRSDSPPPTMNDTDLASGINQLFAVEIEYPEPRQVEFIAEVGIGEPTGEIFPLVVKEAGLYSGKTIPSLFSRKVYSPISKTFEMTIIYDWIIKF